MAQIQRGAKAFAGARDQVYFLSVCSAYCSVDPVTSDMRAHTHPVHNLPFFHTSQCSVLLPSVRSARRMRRKPNKGPLNIVPQQTTTAKAHNYPTTCDVWKSVQTPGKSTNNKSDIQIKLFLLFLVYGEI